MEQEELELQRCVLSFISTLHVAEMWPVWKEDQLEG